MLGVERRPIWWDQSIVLTGMCGQSLKVRHTDQGCACFCSVSWGLDADVSPPTHTHTVQEPGTKVRGHCSPESTLSVSTLAGLLSRR